MTILVTDDHQIFRSAFINLLKAVIEKHCIFYEAKNGADALVLIRDVGFDLVFLDVSMPVMNGYETCKQISLIPSHPPIIMLTQHNEKSVVKHFKDFGVSFITKNADNVDLKVAITKSLMGEQHIEDGLMCDSSADANPMTFSKQEKLLVEKISSGFSSKEIANQMSLSTKSVDTYRERLLKKMKVKNVAELVAKIFKTGNDQG